jgi:hypothetical protein
MPNLFTFQQRKRAYHLSVSKPPKKADQPDSASSQEAKILWALDGLIDAEGPVMVTSWIAIIEYIDHNGESCLAPLSSEMPPWRMAGILETGREMLFADYVYTEEFDEYDE